MLRRALCSARCTVRPAGAVAALGRAHATAPPSILQTAAAIGDTATLTAAVAAEAGVPEGISAARAAARDAGLSVEQRGFLSSLRARLAAEDERHAIAAAAAADANADDGCVDSDGCVDADAADANAAAATAGGTDKASSDDGPSAGAPSAAPSAAPVVPLVRRGHEPLPPWLKLQIPKGPRRRPRYNAIRASLRAKGLSTVCEEANCPNIGECWGGGSSHDEEGGGGAAAAATATIMMMGDTCTRACRFCAVKTARCPAPLDPMEPGNTADAVAAMGVEYVVVTMVDRDDLADGGAAHVRKTMLEIKRKAPRVLVECLAGDFHGRVELVELVATSGLDCYAHNIECVERITPAVRDRRAGYRQSLRVLEAARVVRPSLLTKSSVMLGLGEREAEVRQTLRDLRTAGARAVTLGQYLQPSPSRMKVVRYAHPDEFAMWEREAMAMGFIYCASGPMVRSSYRAGEHYLASLTRKLKSDAEDAAAAASAAAAAPANAGVSGGHIPITPATESGNEDGALCVK